MEGIEVRGQDVLVATTALIDDLLAEIAQIDALDRVGVMAVATDRQFLARVGDRPAVNALLELLVNPQMTTAASLRNIVRVD